MNQAQLIACRECDLLQRKVRLCQSKRHCPGPVLDFDCRNFACFLYDGQGKVGLILLVNKSLEDIKKCGLTVSQRASFNSTYAWSR